VDELEPLEVDEHHPHHLGVLPGLEQPVPEAVVERGAVGQMGEPVHAPRSEIVATAPLQVRQHLVTLDGVEQRLLEDRAFDVALHQVVLRRPLDDGVMGERGGGKLGEQHEGRGGGQLDGEEPEGLQVVRGPGSAAPARRGRRSGRQRRWRRARLWDDGDPRTTRG
jgi:hypothetical protein